MDGPAGAGKSTVAKLVARQMGYLYVDTGAMYRALALKAHRSGIAPDDQAGLAAMAAETSVRLERGENGNRVFLDEADVSAAIREPAIERIVARVSSAPGLRKFMIEAQREIARAGGVVMDGRDIGSHVLPDADRKFFVTASLAELARRRLEQHLLAGHQASQADMEAEIAQRDEQDRNKGESSLVQTADAIYIDTTGRSIQDVVDEILSYCRRD